MPESTTATQEPQQPLSPEMTVKHLRYMLKEAKTDHTVAVRQAEEWRHSKQHTADEAAEEAARWNAQAVYRKDRAAALELAIAILSVLEHPGFTTLALRESLSSGHSAWVWRVGITTIPGVVGTFRYIGAPDAIAALLKAHAALKPQEGALPRKEE